MTKLQEYVTLVLLRENTKLAIKWLDAVGATNGVAGWLRHQLEASLDRDRPRVAVAKINTVLGEMDVVTLFDAVSEVLEMEDRGELGDGDRLSALAKALDKAVAPESSKP